MLTSTENIRRDGARGADLVGGGYTARSGLPATRIDEPVSVVMPVRNALPYLDAAVDSILRQTHGNFELVIGDDGSTDGSRARLRYWAGRDARIRLLESDTSRGPVGSSNWVADQAAFPIVARMDADDISRPRRLERQLAVLRATPDAVLVGTMFDSIDSSGAVTRPFSLSTLLRPDNIPFSHGSIMYRREAFRKAGGYREQCAYFEDVDFYERLGRQGRFLVIAEALYEYRYSRSSARLASQVDAIERALHFYYHIWRRPNGSDELFPRQPPPPRAGRRDARAIVVAGQLRLWAGERPRILTALVKRGQFGLNRSTAKTWAWALAATISPATLRAVLRALDRRRDVAARDRVRVGGVYEWAYAATRREAGGADPIEQLEARSPLIEAR